MAIAPLFVVAAITPEQGPPLIARTWDGELAWRWFFGAVAQGWPVSCTYGPVLQGLDAARRGL